MEELIFLGSLPLGLHKCLVVDFMCSLAWNNISDEIIFIFSECKKTMNATWGGSYENIDTMNIVFFGTSMKYKIIGNFFQISIRIYIKILVERIEIQFAKVE